MKTTNAQLKEFYQLDRALKLIAKRHEELKAHIKENGTCATADFSATIKTSHRTQLAGLKEVEKFIPRQTLDAHGLVKEIDVQTLSVELKAGKEIPALDEVLTDIMKLVDQINTHGEKKGGAA